MSATSPTPRPTPPRTTSTEEMKPVLVLFDGSEKRTLLLEKSPFRVGRKSDNDLVLPDTRVSRQHAEIIFEDNAHYLIDLQSKHGTYVNGERVLRTQLHRNDRIEFGARDGLMLVFSPTKPPTTSREFLKQITQLPGTKTSDLEKLKVFLDAARKLNASSVLDDIVYTLIETSLRLTQAERGFVYLAEAGGGLRLAGAANAKGEALTSDAGISRSIVQEAAESGAEFLVSDTMKHAGVASRQSVVDHELRSVICIPLRKMLHDDEEKSPVLGVLYLDSKFVARDMSATSHDILRAISSEAASLLENAQLAQAEAAAREYQQELHIAAGFQQRLMSVRFPELPWAKLEARNIPCRDIGGDFYDVVQTEQGVALVICDVCGKGVSAALLASIVQGMIYAQLSAGTPLPEIAAAGNRFLCQRDLGEKYATVLIVRVAPDGSAEYLNCGHVLPVVVRGTKLERPEMASVPVGLVPQAQFVAGRLQLHRGDRLLLVTDGITEAENRKLELFGDERLEKAALAADPVTSILRAVEAFRGNAPMSDDLTLMEFVYTG